MWLFYKRNRSNVTILRFPDLKRRSGDNFNGFYGNQSYNEAYILKAFNIEASYDNAKFSTKGGDH